MRVVHAGLAAVVLAGSVSLVAQTGARRDGRWEVTTTRDMPGRGAMPPTKTIQCITKEEANDPSKLVPAQQAGRGGNAGAPDCKMTDSKNNGNKVTFTMKCTGAMAAEMVGDITYTADSYTGTMTMNMDRGGMPMSMVTHLEAKRLGDCEK